MKRRTGFMLLVMCLAMASVFAQTNILVNGDLEDLRPNFWGPTGDGQAGVSCDWAWEGYQSQHSFQVSKTGATSNMAGWLSENNATLYWNDAAADLLYSLSFWAKTSSVNTNPASDDGKIGVQFSFYAGGVLLGESLVPVNQTAASADWAEYTDGLLIPAGAKPDEMYMTLKMGKNATGTVWFDNIGCGSDPWTMGVFGGDAEVPVGWMEWHNVLPDGTPDGFSNLDQTQAHGGTWSVLLKERDDNGDEMVFYSEPVPVDPSTWYKIGVWVKRDSALKNEEWISGNVTNVFQNDRMNVCFFYHKAPIETSFDLTGGDQFFYFDERDSASGWTYYSVISQSTVDAAGISVRARFNNLTKGYCWYDDFTVEPATMVETGVVDEDGNPVSVPATFALGQNYPNPFNPETTIGYTLVQDGRVRLDVYNAMGQKVRTLLDEDRAAGSYRVVWDGMDDLGAKVQSGVYVYRLVTERSTMTMKMVLVK